MEPGNGERYPPLADYGFLADCHTGALVSRRGSVDWWCVPRLDSASCFGRLLDWDRGGHCTVTPADPAARSTRRYLDGTLALETTFESQAGTVRLLDCLLLGHGGKPRLLRRLEGVSGSVDVDVVVDPRFDYGRTRAWIRRHQAGLFSAIGGDQGLVIRCDADADLSGGDRHHLQGRLQVSPGQCVRLLLQFGRPEQLDPEPAQGGPLGDVDAELDDTLKRWRSWAAHSSADSHVLLSALVLKGLSNATSGAIAGALTTSLPESTSGDRNWDYRYSWVRDSTFSLRALAELGYEKEVEAFRSFVERSSAGEGEEVQVLFGVGGERWLPERILDWLEGYRGIGPVRVGNAAAEQTQFDLYGELLDLSWSWQQRGHSPDDDYWAFLVDLVEQAAACWREPDRGIWEVRGEPRHFVYSKVMCWAALDRGVRLAEATGREAPFERWRAAGDEIRRAVETEGYDAERGVFVRAFGSRAVDAALLRLPIAGFVAFDDERMVRTVDAVADDLSVDGLLLRHRDEDEPDAREGVFVGCCFWLAECLARQGRRERAREVFDRARSTANDLGLFAEEYDPERREMVGNFPQALTHLSHIAAALALRGGEAV